MSKKKAGKPIPYTQVPWELFQDHFMQAVAVDKAVDEGMTDEDFKRAECFMALDYSRGCIREGNKLRCKFVRRQHKPIV